MQASRERAPAFPASSSTSRCTRGVMVAQLMNSLPFEFTRRLSPDFAKICRIAASSLTTVMMTSDCAVTSDKSWHAAQPSSPASFVAAARFTSYTAVTWNPQSARRRAMFAPMRPTPTKPMFMLSFPYFCHVERSRDISNYFPDPLELEIPPFGRDDKGISYPSCKKRIAPVLFPHRRHRAVPRTDDRLVRQGQDLFDIISQRVLIRHISAAH